MEGPGRPRKGCKNKRLVAIRPTARMGKQISIRKTDVRAIVPNRHLESVQLTDRIEFELGYGAVRKVVLHLTKKIDLPG